MMHPNSVIRKDPLFFLAECLLDVLVATWSLSLPVDVRGVPSWQLRSGVDQWRRWLKRDGILFSEAMAKDYRNFRRSLRSQNVTLESAKTYLEGLQDFYTFLVGLGWQGSYPVEKPKPMGLRNDIVERKSDGWPIFLPRSRRNKIANQRP